MRRPRWSWRDLLFDVAPVFVLLVVGLLDVAVGLSNPYGHAAKWTAIGPVVVACLALVLRRRQPLITLAVIPGAVAVLAVATPILLTYWGQFVPWLVGMYSAGRHLTWRRGIWAIPISIGAYALLLTAYPAMSEPGDILFNAAVLLGLWSIGRLAASWSAYRDRTLLLEFERVQAEERAEARERTRIARELHDVIAHTITVIVMQAGGARLASAGDRETAVDALARIEVLGRDSLAELRTLLQVLRDEGAESSTAPQPTLADVPALCGRMRSLGLPVRVRTADGTDALPPGVQLAAYRIVQEGLTNVLKHAGIVDTEVDLQVRPGTLVVGVANAPGGDSARVPGSGRGLMGLRERVAALGGTVTGESQPDGGYRLSAMLPVAGGSPA